jgi:putative tricarboxylic transport membrane protein
MSTSIQSPAGSGTAAAPGRPIGELIFALLIISVGVVGFVAGAGIQTPPSASDIGPKAFPYLVSGMLVLVGAGLVIQLLRGGTGVPRRAKDVDPNIATDWADGRQARGIRAAACLPHRAPGLAAAAAACCSSAAPGRSAPVPGGATW